MDREVKREASDGSLRNSAQASRSMASKYFAGIKEETKVEVKRETKERVEGESKQGAKEKAKERVKEVKEERKDSLKPDSNDGGLRSDTSIIPENATDVKPVGSSISMGNKLDSYKRRDSEGTFGGARDEIARAALARSQSTSVIDLVSNSDASVHAEDSPIESAAEIGEASSSARRSTRLQLKCHSSGEGKRRRSEYPSEQASSEEPERGLGTASASSTKAKKKRTKRGYAPPEVYAHLNFVQDCLDYELNIMFCGINPGQKSAGEGHHFANPRNGFWRCLHLGGLTDTLIPPSQDHTLPERFKLGITNLIDRPSAEMAELSMVERRAAVPAFLRRVHKWRPKIVCMVGKGIWDDVFAYMVKASKGKCVDDGVCIEQSSSESRPKGLAEQKANFQFDIQPVGLLHSPEKAAKVERTLFFVVPSTSGRVLTHQLPDKIKLFKLLHKRFEELETGGLEKRVDWSIRLSSGT